MYRIILVIGVALCAALPLGCATTPYARVIARSLNERSPEDFLEKAVVGPRGDGAFVVATTQVIEPAGKSVTFPGRPSR